MERLLKEVQQDYHYPRSPHLKISDLYQWDKTLFPALMTINLHSDTPIPHHPINLITLIFLVLSLQLPRSPPHTLVMDRAGLSGPALAPRTYLVVGPNLSSSMESSLTSLRRLPAISEAQARRLVAKLVKLVMLMWV